MYAENNRGPPWDFPEWVYTIGESVAIMLIASLIAWSTIGQLAGRYASFRTPGPPESEVVQVYVDWSHREERPVLARY